MTSVRPSSADETMRLPRVAPLSASGNNPHRSEVLQGLLNLVAFLLAHPGAPVPLSLSIAVTADGCDGDQISFVREVAGQIDTGVQWQGDRMVFTERPFGPVTYRAFGLVGGALDEYQAVQVIGEQGLAQLQARHAYAAAVEPPACNPFSGVDWYGEGQ
jgi:hypothetical protein